MSGYELVKCNINIIIVIRIISIPKKDFSRREY